MKSEGLDLLRENLWDLFHCFRAVNGVRLSSGRDGAKDSQGWWCPMPGEGGAAVCGGRWMPRWAIPETRSWHNVWVPACPGAEEGAGVSPICQAHRTHGYHSYLCAALRELPCNSEGRLPNASLQEQEQEGNLKPAREKGVIILPVKTTQLCCNHSNKTKADKWWLLWGAFNLNKSSINFSYYW